MEFDDLVSYFEKRGFQTLMVGTTPDRRLLISKEHYKGTYFEDDWITMTRQDQQTEVEEMTSAVELNLSKG